MRLKILHLVSGDRWAGAEVQLYNLIKGLIVQDCEVSAVVLNNGLLAEKLSSLGINVIVLDELKLSAIELLFRFVGVLRQIRPDIIHTHRTKENILGAIAALLVGSCRSVRTVHGMPEFKLTFKQAIIRKVDYLCGRYFQHSLVAVSTALADDLSAQFGASKIKLVLNGIDVDGVIEQSLQGDNSLAQNYSHVGFICRLEPVKRPLFFIDIANDMVRSGVAEKLKFHIVGEGSVRGACEEKVRSLGLGSYFIFHGHLDNPLPIFAGLKALVICSEHEGLPMAALESIALRVELVTNGVGGMKELGDLPGVKVAQDSVQGFVEALKDALSAKVVTNIDKFRARYSNELTARGTLDLYREVERSK